MTNAASRRAPTDRGHDVGAPKVAAGFRANDIIQIDGPDFTFTGKDRRRDRQLPQCFRRAGLSGSSQSRWRVVMTTMTMTEVRALAKTNGMLLYTGSRLGNPKLADGSQAYWLLDDSQTCSTPPGTHIQPEERYSPLGPTTVADCAVWLIDPDYYDPRIEPDDQAPVTDDSGDDDTFAIKISEASAAVTKLLDDAGVMWERITTTKRAVTPLREKICARCSESFTARRIDARYCSPACRQSAHQPG